MYKLTQLLMTTMWIFMMMIMFMAISKMMHPVTLMILMIMFNILSCLILSIWKTNFMFSIIMFLITISGLLIIFMYFSSLISNESMMMKMNPKMITIMMTNLLLMYYLLTSYKLIIMNKFNYNMLDLNPMMSMNLNKMENISNMFYYPFNNLTILSMTFLLIAFISLIKINSSAHSSPMRKINKYE